jgi:5-epi-alpha-selinene synthase
VARGNRAASGEGGRVARTSGVVPRGDGAGPGDRGELEGLQSELFCPFPVELNPELKTAHRLSVAWALDLGLVVEGFALEKLERASFAELEAAVFPHATQEMLTLATLWVTLFCALDDFVEESNLGVLGLSAYLSRSLAGFRGEGNVGPDPILRAFDDFGRRLRVLVGAEAADEFEHELEELYGAFVWEEINRQKAASPDFAGYRLMRVSTVGLRPHFVLARAWGPGGDSKDEPVLEKLERAACLAVGWANDIFTYEKEISAGEVHNIIPVLMRTERLPLREALQRARALHDSEVCGFLRLQARLGVAADAADATGYRVAHLRRWIGGHLQWARENGRYGSGRVAV